MTSRLPHILRGLVTVLALIIVTGTVFAYPKPASVPYRWELRFEPGDLRLYVDEVTGEAYWFFVYKVTNRTGRDQMWAPELTLFLDSGEILTSGRDVPRHVTNQLLGLMGNPLLLEQNAIIGPILQGREHALEGLAVWPARELDVNSVSLFVAGLSGETVRYQPPGNADAEILRKTLQRNYHVGGDPLARGTRPLKMVDETWVMR